MRQRWRVEFVDFTEVKAASFFALPNFSSPKFSMEAILIMLPVILVIASEHIGHQIVTKARSSVGI